MATMQDLNSELPGRTQQIGNPAKFLWGGLGGLTPVLGTLIILDFATLGMYLGDLGTNEMRIYSLAGYTVRVLILFLIGGLWAVLHKSEREPMKLFQLGLVAPAMITGMINAGNVQVEKDPHSADQQATFSFSIISSAYAKDDQQPESDQEIEDGQEKPANPSPVDEFLKGIFGR